MRLVVFDLDGTLVDSGAQIVRAMEHAYAVSGRTPPAPDAVLAIVGLSLPHAVERLSPGIRGDLRDRIVAAYRAAFLADPAAPPLYPDAATVLRELSETPGVRLALATGKAKRGLTRVLDQHGLRPLFASLHGGDEHPSKPDPSMLRAALRAAGVEPPDAVMVGDSIYDVAMAAACGVAAIGVGWGYHTADALRGAGASVVVHSFPELAALLQRRRAAA